MQYLRERKWPHLPRSSLANAVNSKVIPRPYLKTCTVLDQVRAPDLHAVLAGRSLLRQTVRRTHCQVVLRRSLSSSTTFARPEVTPFALSPTSSQPTSTEPTSTSIFARTLARKRPSLVELELVWALATLRRSIAPHGKSSTHRQARLGINFSLRKGQLAGKTWN